MYVRPLTVANGRGAIDPDRRDQLAAGVWRHVPENVYWRRLAAMRDVLLREEADPPPPEEAEGYEPPARPVSVPAVAPAAAAAEPARATPADLAMAARGTAPAADAAPAKA